jgi:hypothetical protein
MVDVTGVLRHTAIDKKQQNLLCQLPRCTDRAGLLDFQFESAMSGLQRLQYLPSGSGVSLLLWVRFQAPIAINLIWIGPLSV